MKYFAVILLLSLVIVGGCSKDSTTTGPGTTGNSNYFPLTAGSYWQYKTSDSTATRRVIGTTTFNSKSYVAIYDFSTGDTLRLRQSGSAYYLLTPDATGTTLQEVQILDETLNATWGFSNTVSGVTFSESFKTTEVGLTRIVNGKTYSNVIHVHVDENFGGSISGSELYFAKGIGEIEQVNTTTSIESLLNYHVN